MKPLAQRLLYVADLSLLRVAALLVPRKLRGEWRREWLSELWHVRQACAPDGRISWRREQEITMFCIGAFQDALCFRREARESWNPLTAFRGSSAQCLVFLGALLTASYVLSLLLPGVSAERAMSGYRISPGLVLIQNERAKSSSEPTISRAQFQAWTKSSQPYFDGLAFYRVAEEPFSLASNPQSTWAVAHADANLFTVLGLPLLQTAPAGGSDSNMPRIILSESAWKRKFNANPGVAGAVVRLGQRDDRIVGVAPDNSSGLPGKVDAWILEPDGEIAASGNGYVVARLTPMGRSEMWAARLAITGQEDLWGISLDDATPRPWGAFLSMVLLALLALPAVTSVSLEESSVSHQNTSWTRRLSRAGFLGVKIVLLLSIAYFASLDLAYSNTALSSSSSAYILLIFNFAICLFGMRWALKDQRQRCPVCLRIVTNPADVGQASRTFLAWSGTELMCMDGHTLLHVPGAPTSWFSAQRWLYLDTSWGFLFAVSDAGANKEGLVGLTPN
jgi:hypothetical protein